ncbi:MAG TPA: glucosaminidase domain-containing protein [Kofleriaceae bacterium]|nr:glucosaminidase domain-containing protein [Kofleriaceae bacterium]
MMRTLLLSCCLLAGCIVGDEREPETGTLAATWGPYDPQPGHPTQADRDAFVAQISQYAEEGEQRYGTPAADIIAMACNESGFGWTRIALNANNLFGYKWTSYAMAGGRGFWTLEDQPADDPGNQYIDFADRRDAVLYVAQRLATSTRYKPTTDQYSADIANGMDVKSAADRWIYGIASAGYNPYEHYPVTTIKFMNNYRTPSLTRSPTYDLYRYSAEAAPAAWVSIDAPAANAYVAGNVTLTSHASASTTSVQFASRAKGASDWYSLGAATTSPFMRTWATSGYVPNGQYELRAQAYRGTTLVATGVITVTVAN